MRWDLSLLLKKLLRLRWHRSSLWWRAVVDNSHSLELKKMKHRNLQQGLRSWGSAGLFSHGNWCSTAILIQDLWGSCSELSARAHSSMTAASPVHVAGVSPRRRKLDVLLGLEGIFYAFKYSDGLTSTFICDRTSFISGVFAWFAE